MTWMRSFGSVCLVLLIVGIADGFSMNSPDRTAPTTSHSVTASRRNFMGQAAISLGTLLLPGFPAVAKDEPLPERDVVTATFEQVRYELSDPNGGVAYMQQKIDEQDWGSLLEFTKTYDQELRKLRMGKAKKLIQDKELKSRATEYANGVTFDLIGINRASRTGQENVDSANKYLEELREDVSKFLELERSVAVAGSSSTSP